MARFISVVFACVALALSTDAFAYPVTLSFLDGAGRPVPAIKIRGSYGINGLPILSSDAQGRWSFDTNDVTSTDSVLVFSGAATGMQLEPAEIKVADIVAAGVRSRTVRATPSTSPSTIVSWTYFSSYTGRLAGLPVAILNPYGYSCNYRKTDSNGYVAWSVPKPTGVCKDATATTAWYQIVPAEDANLRCSAFVTSRTNGSRSCPYLGDDEQGYSTGSCSVVTPPAPSLSSTIKISVTAAGTTYGIPGVEVVGNANVMAIASRQTNSLGDFSFTIGSVPGAQATTVFDISPVKAGYEFFPRSRTTRECAYVGMNTYQCKFSGVRTNAGQGAVVLTASQAGQGLSGVSVSAPVALGCLSPGVKTSDGFGRMVFPVRVRPQCSPAGSTTWNAPVTLYPSMPGKGFVSPTNFEVCPTSLITQAAVSAYDANSGVQNYAVSGKVLTVAGAGFAGAELYVNDALYGQTDATGAFRIAPVVQGTTIKLAARSGDLKFDPEFESFVEVGSDVQTTIRARAPDPAAGGIDPPAKSCPVQSEYAVSGLVLDLAGRPQVGAQIFLNEAAVPAAVTDESGHYEFKVPFQSDAWVSVKKGSSRYAPMGRALNEIVCDEADVDFQEVSFDSVVISGTVLDSDGLPIEGIDVEARVNGIPLTYPIVSSSEGIFRFTAPQGSAVVAAPLDGRYVFAPASDTIDLVSTDETLTTFRADRPTVISPTPAPTALPTVAPPLATAPPNPIATSTAVAPPVAPPTTQPLPTSGAQPPPPVPTLAPTAGGPPGGAPPPGGVVPTQSPGAPVPAPLPVVPTPVVVPPTPVAQPTGGGGGPLPATPTPSAPAPTSVPQPPSAPPALPGQPTAAPTQAPIATVTPLPPEVFPTVRVRASCGSSATSGALEWVVSNDGVVDLVGGWEALDITQPNVVVDSAPLTQIAGGSSTFSTALKGVFKDFYRLHVFVFDRSGARVTLALERWDIARCSPAPTPTPTPTLPGVQPPVAPVLPPSAPPGEGLPPVVQPPGGSPPQPPVAPPGGGIGPTPTPIVTATPTATPIPMYEISGSIRDGVVNGKRLTAAVKKQLVALGATVEVRGMAGANFSASVPFSQLDDNSYSVSAPEGRYRVRIIASQQNTLSVKSVFRKSATSYTCALPGTTSRCRNITFSVAPRSLLQGAGR
jgi:hypothetical protein